MNISDFLTAIVMGVVEGFTEFLPVSSTGHLIIAGEFLKFRGEVAKLFEVFIQLGAIFAVLWLYRAKLVRFIFEINKKIESKNFFINIFIAFLPSAVIGFLTHKLIKQYLFNPWTVSFALISGGIIIIIIEKARHKDSINKIENINFKSAFFIGVSQILALFPGISRAGATIMGGILSGLTRKTATEFSFFLAIPTMFAATLFDLFKNYCLLNTRNTGILVTGFITAFFSAMISVKWLISFISTHDFRLLAYYRIVIGIIMLFIFTFL